jgi:hypothetical protein
MALFNNDEDPALLSTHGMYTDLFKVIRLGLLKDTIRLYKLN